MAIELIPYGALPSFQRQLLPLTPRKKVGPVQQLVAGSASAVFALPLPAGTQYVHIITDTDCRIEIGDASVVASKTADTTLSRKLISGREYAIEAKAGDYVALIQAS